MPAGQEPQAVPVGPAGAVEPEELPPPGEPPDGERQVHGEPRRGGRPPQEDRAVGLASAEPFRGERDEQQTGEELGGGPQTDQRTRPPVAAAEERQHRPPWRARRRRDPSSRTPAEPGVGASANQSARRGSIRYRHAAATAAHTASRIAFTQKKRPGSSPEIQPASPHEVHREHGVLVAVVVRRNARVEVGEAAPGELLGGEQRHDVRVAGEVVLTAVGPVASGARALLDRRRSAASRRGTPARARG